MKILVSIIYETDERNVQGAGPFEGPEGRIFETGGIPISQYQQRSLFRARATNLRWAHRNMTPAKAATTAAQMMSSSVQNTATNCGSVTRRDFMTRWVRDSTRFEY